jgi:hypothetical protein
MARAVELGVGLQPIETEPGPKYFTWAEVNYLNISTEPWASQGGITTGSIRVEWNANMTTFEANRAATYRQWAIDNLGGETVPVNGVNLITYKLA